jgi:hypothetical protein
MAKYRITSIPQYAPGGETNWPPDWMKRKKKKSNSETNFEYNYKPSTEESMVQGVNPQNMWGDVTSLYENVGREDYTKTPEEEVDSFYEPVSWKYGETAPAYDYTYKSPRNPMRNPITENSYRNSLENKLGMSYSAYSGNPIEQNTIRMDEKFTPDYFAPFTETGQPLTCTGGKIAYKGQCITEEAFAIIRQREIELEDFTYQREQEERKKKFELTINEIVRDTEEDEARYTDTRIRDYFTNYKKSGKQTKVEPIETLSTSILSKKIPKIDANGNEVIDKKTGKPVMETIEENLKRTYFINKTENGFANLYPLEIMDDRIKHSGFFNNEFETYWGLDPKQLKAQVGDVQKQAKAVYDNRVTNLIMDNALKNGIAPYEAAANLSKRLGYTSNFRNQHVPIVNKNIDDFYSKFVEESLSSLQKEMGVYVDKEGRTRHDTKKPDDKQNVNFNFLEDHTKYVYDETGVLVSQEFDPVGKYATAWINSAPTQKEKIARQNKVNAIKNKNYTAVGKKAYDESLNDPLSGYQADPFEDMTHQQVTNMYGDQMQERVRYQNTPFNTLAIGRAIDAKNSAEYSKMETDLAEATGFDKDFATYMTNGKRARIYDIYQEALKNKKIDYSSKVKIINAIDKGDMDYTMDLLLSGTDDPEKDADIFKFADTFKDQLDNTLGFETYYNDLSRPYFSAAKKPFGNKKQIGLGTKIWDGVTNPIDLSYYLMNMKGDDMYGSNPTESYNDRLESERKYNKGYGTRSSLSTGTSFGPLEFLNVFNALNPLNYGDDIYRGYEANGITGASARMSQKNWEALEALSMFVPGGAGFKLGRQAVALRNTATALNAAKNAGNLGVRALNLGSRTFNTVGRGLNYMGRTTGYPGQYVANYLTKAALPFTLDAIRPGGYLQTGYGDLSKGNYGDAAENLALGSLGISPLVRKGIQAVRTGVNRLNTGVDLTPSLRNINPEGTTFATNAEQFRQLAKLDKKYYRSLQQQVHPDIQGGSNEASAFLNDLYKGKGFQNIPFNASMQTGILTPKYKFGPFSAGQNVFQPKTLEELLQIPEQIPKAARTFRGGRIRLHQTGGVIDGLRQLGKYKNGGALPKFQYRGAVNLYKGIQNLIKPIQSVNKVFGTTIGSLYKYNPLAEKLNNPLKSYRVSGMNAARDFQNTGVLRSIRPSNPEGSSLLQRAHNRPTPFPSFQKGYADMSYLPEEGGVIFETGLPTFKRGQINPVTGFPIKGKHYAHRVIDPETGATMTEIPGESIKMFSDKPHWLKGYQQILKELPGSPNAVSSVDDVGKSLTQQPIYRGVYINDEIRNLPKFKGRTDDEILDIMGTTIPGNTGTRRKSQLNQTLNFGRDYNSALAHIGKFTDEGALSRLGNTKDLTSGQMYILKVQPDDLPFISAEQQSKLYKQHIDAWKKNNPDLFILGTDAKNINPELLKEFGESAAFRTEGTNVFSGNFPQYVGAENTKIGKLLESKKVSRQDYLDYLEKLKINSKPINKNIFKLLNNGMPIEVPKQLPGSPNSSSLIEPFEIAKTRIINSSNNFNRITRKPDPVIKSNYGQLEFAFPEEPVGLSAKLMNEQKIIDGMERARVASEERSLAIEQANAIKSPTEIPKIYPIGNPDYYIDLLNMTPMSLANREFYKSIIQSIKNQNNVASEKQKDILDRIKTGNFKYNQGGSLNNFEKGGAIKINLNKKEIEEYIKNGYVIEEQ